MEYFQSSILENESYIRAGFFLFLLVILLFLEHLWPRKTTENQVNRRMNNLLLMLINILMMRLLIPLATIQVAIISAEQNTGLFNLFGLPLLLNILLTVLIFDLLIYVQHVLFHKFKLLWTIHKVHHTDVILDTTTGVRFHPLEMLLSLLLKLLAVYLFGVAALAIVIYEILLNSASLFTHSNISLGNKLDRTLRILFVTPDMHRVHHSVIKQETDSNYGNLFSFWDRIFKTYIDKPRVDYQQIDIGLNEYKNTPTSSLIFMLKTPFVNGR